LFYVQLRLIEVENCKLLQQALFAVDLVENFFDVIIVVLEDAFAEV